MSGRLRTRQVLTVDYRVRRSRCGRNVLISSSVSRTRTLTRHWMFSAPTLRTTPSMTPPTTSLSSQGQSTSAWGRDRGDRGPNNLGKAPYPDYRQSPYPDSVDRQARWKALRSRGIPNILLDLIVALHEHTGSSVRHGEKLSTRFLTTSGVRQGCVLAPALFCVAIDWILNHMDANGH